MTLGTVPGVEKKVSRIGHGCMMLRSGEGQGETNRILDAAWETGVNLYDHSNVYGGGDSERAFGVWLRERGRSSGEGREELVILDKGCHPKDGEKRVTPENIRTDVEGSLDRPGRDRLRPAPAHEHLRTHRRVFKRRGGGESRCAGGRPHP